MIYSGDNIAGSVCIMVQFSNRLFFGIASGVLAMLGAGNAAAQNLSAVNADQLETILTDAGLGVSMTQDAASGAPVANAQLGDITFWVRALECSGRPQACETLVFFANFQLGRAAADADYKIINSFNDSQVFGRAYVIERKAEVGVDYVIELSGGVSADHVAQNVGRWADVISAFIDKFSSGAAGA